VDLNSLRRTHQLSLMAVERSMTPRDKRAHEQFARDYAEQIHFVRDALAPRPNAAGVGHVSERELVDERQADPAGGRSMVFRKRRNSPALTPDQSRRQSEVVQSTWRHFREAAPVIAFLNARHEALDGQPLLLAIESDEGLERVERLLEQLTRNC